MNLITPIILLIVSAVMVFGYVNPIYRNHTDANGNPDSIQDLQKTANGYTETLNNQVALKNKVDSLIVKKNRISQDDLANLQRLLPENVDNVRLIVEMESLVKKYSPKGFKSINISKSANANSNDGSNGAIVSEGDKYNSLSINFVVSMSYENLVRFLQELEANLRLADITNISFSSNETGTYDYSVSLKTYWLK